MKHYSLEVIYRRVTLFSDECDVSIVLFPIRALFVIRNAPTLIRHMLTMQPKIIKALVAIRNDVTYFTVLCINIHGAIICVSRIPDYYNGC